MGKRGLLTLSCTALALLLLSGCATAHRRPSVDSEEFALGILKGQLRGLPASAENIHAHYESHPVGSVLFGCLEAETSALEAVFDRSHRLPMNRQLFEAGPAKDWMLKSRSFYSERCPWWKPERASRFGQVDMVKRYNDCLWDGDAPRRFYQTTSHYAGLGDIGDGRNVLYLFVRWEEPEQDRSGTE